MRSGATVPHIPSDLVTDCIDTTVTLASHVSSLVASAFGLLRDP